jgi:hypothetical protein
MQRPAWAQLHIDRTFNATQLQSGNTCGKEPLMLFLWPGWCCCCLLCCWLL